MSRKTTKQRKAAQKRNQLFKRVKVTMRVTNAWYPLEAALRNLRRNHYVVVEHHKTIVEQTRPGCNYVYPVSLTISEKVCQEYRFRERLCSTTPINNPIWGNLGNVWIERVEPKKKRPGS